MEWLDDVTLQRWLQMRLLHKLERVQYTTAVIVDKLTASTRLLRYSPASTLSTASTQPILDQHQHHIIDKLICLLRPRCLIYIYIYITAGYDFAGSSTSTHKVDIDGLDCCGAVY